MRTEYLGLIPAPDPQPLLPSGCAVCGRTENLKTCSACQGISYCGIEHQKAHRSEHKVLCKPISDNRGVMEHLEQVILHKQQIPIHLYKTLPVNLEVLDYDGRVDYGEAAFDSINCYERLYSFKAIEACLKIQLILFPMSPDPWRSGGLVASLMLRLNQDLEAYGMIKSLILFMGRTEPGQTAPATIENLDPFESVEMFLQADFPYELRESVASLLVSLVLLKVKLLLDLKDLQQWRDTNPNTSIDDTQLNLIRCPKIIKRIVILARRDHSSEIANSETQINQLYKRIHQENTNFWKALEALDMDCMISRRGSPVGSMLEANAWYMTQRYSWPETPGAVDWLKTQNATLQN